jgi:uncharacterized NAD(P)/FAD-binding protein YdhS
VGYDEADNLVRTPGGGHVHAHNERFDMLIRATGFDTDVDRTTHPLMMHLRESGLATGDVLGLGLEVSRHYEVLNAYGRAVPGPYCLGPLLRGRLWEITAVPELRTAARTLARRLSGPSEAWVARESADSDTGVLSRGGG